MPPKKNLKLSAVRLRRLFRIFSRGDFLAAAGGENGSHYLKNTAPTNQNEVRFGVGQYQSMIWFWPPPATLCSIYIYILKSKKKPNQVYTGYSADLKKRFAEHNRGKSLATKPYLPWELVFYEAYKSKADAKRREMYLKTTKGRKAIKLMLVESMK